MDEHEHHGSLIDGIARQFAPILETSEQGIYLYFDDEHKVCNEKLAEMLGYESAVEWAKVTDSFPDVFIAENSQDALINSYQDAMEKCVASENKITWKKKDGSTLETKVILVPVAFEDHLLALHFVSAV